MGPLRRAFPWRTGLLLSSAPVLALITFLAWLWWELPPLERYYLLAYWESSKNAERPDSTTQIEWLYKTAPGLESEPVIRRDVDSNGVGYLSMRLSSSAREEGWTQLLKISAQTWKSSELASFLQQDFYGNRTFREVMVEPLFFICVIPFVVLYGATIMRRELTEEWRRLYEEICDGRSAFDSHSLWTRLEGRIRLWLRAQLAGAQATLSRAESFTREQPNRAAIATTVSDGIGDVPRTGQADQSTPPSTAPQPYLIFPGAAAMRSATSHPTQWDESQWID